MRIVSIETLEFPLCKSIVILCYNEDTTLYKDDLSIITINELTEIINILLKEI